MAKVPGIKLSLGGKELELPPISLGMLRKGLMAKLEKYDQLVAEGKQFEATSLSGEIIIEALRRNYTAEELPDDEIWDRLDLGNANLAFRTVLGLSGFTPSGEELAAKEATENGT